MKIVKVISGDLWAGAEVQAYNTMIALTAKSNVELVCIVFNEGMLSKKLRGENITTLLINEKNNSVRAIIDKLCIKIKKLQPDIIHVDLVKEHFTTKLAILKSSKKIPLVRTVHGARKAPVHLSFFKGFRSKSVVFVDNWLIANAADAVIAVSKQLEKEFYNRNVKGSIHQIYNAINPCNYQNFENVQTIKQKFDASDKYWIGTAARLAEPKNLKMLIKAGKHLNENGLPFKISIFGDGPLKRDLQALIDSMKLGEKVVLHGFEPDIAPIISSLDAFVLCSIHEGLPMVLLEAMLLGTPIVGTDVIGINEVIEDGKNGYLVQLDDYIALGDALLKIKNDKDKTTEYIKNSVEIFNGKFSIEVMANKLINVYKNTIDRNL